MHSRSIPNLLHRLKVQGRVRFLANGVYAGPLAAAPPNRYRVPRALRDDAVVALHSALELHGVANQVFQTVYYFSAGARKDVVFDHVTYHRVAFPRALAISSRRLFQTELVADNILATGRERSFVDCLLFLDYGGGVEELDKSLAMFPSFDFEAALAYLKFLGRPWLYARLDSCSTVTPTNFSSAAKFATDSSGNFRAASFISPRSVPEITGFPPGNSWCPKPYCLLRKARCAREIRRRANYEARARDGISRRQSRKVLRLRELLTELHKHPFLSGKLVLKGGTALNLFYLDLARLSVDIDLNYIAHIDREATLQERPGITRAVEQVATGLGYKLQNGVDEYALREWYLNYQNHTGKPDRIRSRSTSSCVLARSLQKSSPLRRWRERRPVNFLCWKPRSCSAGRSRPWSIAATRAISTIYSASPKEA